MSCANATVRVESNEPLKVWCSRGRASAVACPDQVETGTSALLQAIVRDMRKTQTGYRTVFNVVEPDCPNCTHNCCVQPFLNKTPFYGEDAIYYLLIGQQLPNIPRNADHCIFFDRGCSLPAHLRPHVCIEYACPFVESPPKMDELGRRLNEGAIYLLAVATGEFADWRGAVEDVDERGEMSGLMVDRFGNRWDPNDPLADLYERYGVPVEARR